MRPASFPPGVGDGSLELAMDSVFGDIAQWSSQIGSALSYVEGQQFLGYPQLVLMAQRPEYRRMVERIAQEMTRRWIKFESKGDDDKSEAIEKIAAEFERLGVKSAFQECAEHDGFFGRGHIYMDFGDEGDEELALPVGDGADKLSASKVSQERPLRRIKCVEAMWTYPLDYNTLDPLHPQWYRPNKWQVYSRTVHASRLLTFIGREVPDMLKPVYGFGGLSLTQMAKPYVDNWLRTRQSVSDLIAAFSQFVLMTNAAEALMQGGDALFTRVDFFNQMRDNRGTLVLDKETEDLKNVSAPLGTLDKLQAQSQEHMAAVCGLPIVVLLGIQPAGLNASSEGELEAFATWVNAKQESDFRPNLTRLFHFVQLSLFGNIDPSLTFSFVPLRDVSEEEASKIRETDARTGKTLIEAGVITPAEERQRVMSDERSGYASLEGKVAPLPPISIAATAAANAVSAIMSVHDAGLISDMTALKELQTLNLRVGLFGKITEADIAQADYEPPGGAGGQPDFPMLPQQTPFNKENAKTSWLDSSSSFGASDARTIWEEHKHPRGQAKNRGQFKSKSKDDVRIKINASPMTTEERRKLVDEQTRAVVDAAKRENYPLDKLDVMDIDDFPETHELYSMKGSLEGFANHADDRITILVGRPNSSPAHIVGVLMHEIEHVKFESVLRKMDEEQGAFLAAGEKADYVRDIDENKYPTLRALSPYLNSAAGQSALAEDDGVTPYSHSVWQDFHGKLRPSAGDFFLGVHETLAEIARVDYELNNGSLSPMDWRPPSPIWADFYHSVNECWRRIGGFR